MHLYPHPIFLPAPSPSRQWQCKIPPSAHKPDQPIFYISRPPKKKEDAGCNANKAEVVMLSFARISIITTLSAQP